MQVNNETSYKSQFTTRARINFSKLYREKL